jgi:hypothetical protein
VTQKWRSPKSESRKLDGAAFSTRNSSAKTNCGASSRRSSPLPRRHRRAWRWIGAFPSYTQGVPAEHNRSRSRTHRILRGCCCNTIGRPMATRHGIWSQDRRLCGNQCCRCMGRPHGTPNGRKHALDTKCSMMVVTEWVDPLLATVVRRLVGHYLRCATLIISAAPATMPVPPGTYSWPGAGWRAEPAAATRKTCGRWPNILA